MAKVIDFLKGNYLCILIGGLVGYLFCHFTVVKKYKRESEYRKKVTMRMARNAAMNSNKRKTM